MSKKASYYARLRVRVEVGAKPDYDRDRLILEKALHDPNTPAVSKRRTKFYLAQTYMEMNLDQKAINMYEARFKDGGWYEEQWYSLFSIAKCYEKLKKKAKKDGQRLAELENEQKAIVAYCRAHDFRNSRAEAMCSLAALYRKKGLNRLAFMCAMEAKKANIGDDKLFIDKSVYEYRIDFELWIAGSHLADKKDIATKAHQRLKAIGQKLPKKIGQRVEKNDQAYAHVQVG